MPNTDRKLRVFLCHASQDKPVVRELYQRLLAEGWIEPWLDEEKLLPGQDWDMEIEKAVEAADAVIVCLSSNSVTKEGYVQRELRFVLDIADYKPEETVFVIPVRLDDCPAPRRLRRMHYVDYFPNERQEKAYNRLRDSLEFRAKALKVVQIKQASPWTNLVSENREFYSNTSGRISAENSHIPKVFISYSHIDEKHMRRLVSMLRPFEKQKAFEIWNDREITAGDEWYQDIQNAINSCEIALLLISIDFLNSRFIQEEELSRLLQLRKEKGLRIVPIIIRDCPWTSVPILKDLQALPKDGKPVINFTGTNQPDRIWAEIALTIERLAEYSG